MKISMFYSSNKKKKRSIPTAVFTSTFYTCQGFQTIRLSVLSLDKCGNLQCAVKYHSLLERKRKTFNPGFMICYLIILLC